jgi:hypothetical protein
MLLRVERKIDPASLVLIKMPLREQDGLSKFSIIPQNLEEMTARRYRVSSLGETEQHMEICLPALLKLQKLWRVQFLFTYLVTGLKAIVESARKGLLKTGLPTRAPTQVN